MQTPRQTTYRPGPGGTRQLEAIHTRKIVHATNRLGSPEESKPRTGYHNQRCRLLRLRNPEGHAMYNLAKYSNSTRNWRPSCQTLLGKRHQRGPGWAGVEATHQDYRQNRGPLYRNAIQKDSAFGEAWPHTKKWMGGLPTRGTPFGPGCLPLTQQACGPADMPAWADTSTR